MDCNRDEAARSRGIAETKFLQQDYAGARKFALKARQLFPHLEGLPQLIAVLDVHVTAQEKLQSGEMNWYGMLQSDPSADEASLRKQYRKLALVLHPDKNKSIGAEAAFKFICQAWTVLSDKEKKAAYDMKTNSMASKTGLYTKPRSASHGNHNVTPPPTARPPQPPPEPPSPVMKTFWTACPLCKLQYEYQRIYENKNLCCPFCYKPFLATEVALVNGTTVWPLQEQKAANMDVKDAPHHPNGSNVNPFFKGNFPRPFENRDAPATHSTQSQVNVKARKENIEVRKPSGSKKAYDCLDAKSKGVIEQNLSSDKLFVSGCEGAVDDAETAHACIRSQKPLTSEGLNASGQKTCARKDMPTDPDEKNTARKENRTIQDSEDIGEVENFSLANPDEQVTPKSQNAKRNTLSHTDHEVQLDVSPVKKAKVDCQDSNNEKMLKDGIFEKDESRLPDVGSDKGTDGQCLASGSKLTANIFKEPSMQENNLPSMAGKHSPSMCDTEMNSMAEAPDAINVPDADFYVFDKDRTEHHFSAGQIWASYDDDEGFPRFYARVLKVISRQPFKIQFTWLEACTSSNEIMLWLASGFSYTCGEYKLGKTSTTDSVNMFSHVMTFEEGQRGAFKIYPRKGDIWALYKEWRTLKTKDEKHGYDLAEVLTDYTDQSGVKVSMLVKVEGFRTIFQQQHGVVHWIFPKEMLRFSHNIPAHRLMAGEGPRVVEGCLELDPASIPRKLCEKLEE